MHWLYHGEVLEFRTGFHAGDLDLAPVAKWADALIKKSAPRLECHHFADDGYETLLIGVRLKERPGYGGADFFALGERVRSDEEFAALDVAEKIEVKVRREFRIEPSFRGSGIRVTSD